MSCSLLYLFRSFTALAMVVLLGAGGALAEVVNFEDLPLGPNSYWNGSDGTGGFVSGGVSFANTFTDWGGGWTSWTGWAYSNMTDSTTPGIGSQYSAFPGGGHAGSSNYAVYYDGFWDAEPTLTGIPAGTLLGAYFTNTTYTALAMQEGDSFSKKFEDGDWFDLTVTGLDSGGSETGNVVFPLADFRDDNNYIVDDWTWVDLSGLGNATELQFTLNSSDVGDSGMNTPAYFAMDNLTLGVIPEPSTLLLLVCGGAAGAAVLGRRRKRRAA